MENTVHVLFRAEVPLEHVTEQADHEPQSVHEAVTSWQSSILQLTASTALSPLWLQ